MPARCDLPSPSASSDASASAAALPDFDAILVVSFGGPEGPDDVLPFLGNVLRGKNVPHERMLAVAEHYQHFGGVSPINAQNRQLIAALAAELARSGPSLPIYWGNRNWHPMLPDTLAQMKADGIRRALGFFTSAYSSYSGCRQYREDIAAAQAAVGQGAPRVDKLRVFFNHPGFVAAQIDRLKESLRQLPADRQTAARLMFTAHSIPLAMAQNCRYEQQLEEASRLVAEGAGFDNWELVFQSRSGPPSQPWLEPDVLDAIRALPDGARDVVAVPIGFVSDHMEVLYDLDTEAADACRERGIELHRVATVGSHPIFIRAIRDLIVERVLGSSDRAVVGALPASHDVCPADCCLSGRPPSVGARSPVA